MNRKKIILRSRSFMRLIGKGFICVILLSGCGGGGGSDSPPPSPPPLFSTADLAGTWNTFAVSTGGNFPGVIMGTFVLNSSGQVVGGNATRYGSDGGGAVTFTGGTIGINGGSGMISGSVTMTNGTVTIISGKMREDDKNLFAWVDGTSQGQYDMGIALKTGASYSLPPAVTSLPYYVYGVSSGGTNLGVMGGSVLLSPNWSVTGGTITRYAFGGGGSATFTGGRIFLSSSGILSGSMTTNNETISIRQGMMEEWGDLLVWIDSTSLNQYDMGVSQSGYRVGVSTADLAGNWYYYGASSGGANTGVIAGNIVFSASGQITGGSVTRYALNGGGSAIFTWGLVNMDSTGNVTGSASTTRETIFIDASRINRSCNLMPWVTHTSLGEYSFGLLIKGN